jgi:hypothetical protein
MTLMVIASLLWLLLLAPWNFNPRFVPQIQIFFLHLIFNLFWYTKQIIAKVFPRFKLASAAIGCHKITCDGDKSFDMKLIAQLISLPTRSHRSFYFFVGFVYPLLPLDLTSNKSESWNRIYACFVYILNRDKLIVRSEYITQKYAIEFARKSRTQLKISDAKLRYMICTIMWELVFSSEPNESDLKTIIELIESISRSFTYNMDSDWSNRISLCVSFMEQMRDYPKIITLQNDFKLTSQEMCTVIAMELFITPALEIAEVMSNLMTELTLEHTDLIRKLSNDPNLMRYAIIATAHRFPVLQAIFREYPYVKGDQYLTPCFNLFSDIHAVEIQTQAISQSLKNESIIFDINRYISNVNNQESTVSEISTCMAFGKGPRVCKGKELAIKIITSFLTNLYLELGQWPNVDISAGRKCSPFHSVNHRLYYFNRRCWIADVQYFLDKIYRKSTLQRFECQL